MSRGMRLFKASAFPLSCLCLAYANALALAAPSPGISKGISDEEWGKIAGTHAADIYEISKGDSLSAVSKRMFGDVEYWGKVWALNQRNITNPHLIHPGLRVAFTPGTGDSLPQLAFADSDSDTTGGPSPSRPLYSDNPKGLFSSGKTPKGEWKKLPTQPWEYYAVKKTDVRSDKLGFDKNSVIKIARAKGLEIPMLAASEPYEALGEITGTTKESSAIGIHEPVYIEAVEGLQVGETYTVTDPDPRKVKFTTGSRQAFMYTNKAKIRIVSVRDEVFIGVVTELRDPIFRGDILIPRIDKFEDTQLRPGSSPLVAEVGFDRYFSTYATTQHKFVTLNAGTVDGIEPGMVFRSYQYDDPYNGRDIMKANIVIRADFWVVQASEKVSVALVVTSDLQVEDHAPVTLLTDLSQLKRIQDALSIKGVDTQLDELDRLDNAEALGAEEDKTLKQLELWRGNPPAPEEVVPTEEGSSTSAPPSEDGEIAPPETPGETDELDDLDAPLEEGAPAPNPAEPAEPPPAPDESLAPPPADAGTAAPEIDPQTLPGEQPPPTQDLDAIDEAPPI